MRGPLLIRLAAGASSVLLAGFCGMTQAEAAMKLRCTIADDGNAAAGPDPRSFILRVDSPHRITDEAGQEFAVTLAGPSMEFDGWGGHFSLDRRQPVFTFSKDGRVYNGECKKVADEDG
jgi:hypothetical protein